MDNELTLENVKDNYLQKSYELVYIDYRDSLENSYDKIQEAIQTRDLQPIYEETDEWFIDSRYDSVDYILKELKEDLERDYEDCENGNIEKFIKDNRRELTEIILERDNSDPVKDLLKNTDNPVYFYDTGYEIVDSVFDEEAYQENIRSIEEAFKIKYDDYKKEIDELIINASYGGRLVIYFREDVMKMINTEEFNTITFKNPVIAAINTYNGSGSDTILNDHEFSLPYDPSNLFVEETIKYNYTYAVCGMSDSWCDSTDVSFSKENNGETIERSKLHAELGVEGLYNQAYKGGKCTFGDMDMNRHRNTYYDNNFPCGTHCKDCGTFWID